MYARRVWVCLGTVPEKTFDALVVDMKKIHV